MFGSTVWSQVSLSYLTLWSRTPCMEAVSSFSTRSCSPVCCLNSTTSLSYSLSNKTSQNHILGGSTRIVQRHIHSPAIHLDSSGPLAQSLGETARLTTDSELISFVNFSTLRNYSCVSLAKKCCNDSLKFW